MPKSTRSNKSRRPRGRGGKGDKNARRALAYALSFIVVLVLGLYGLYKLKENIPPQDRAQTVTAEKMSGPLKETPRARRAEKKPVETPKERKVEKPRVAREPGKTGEAAGKGESADSGAFEPKIAIIVDDIGMNKGPIDRLIELPAPVTLSVLPNLPYSKYAAEAARNKGLDVMLHLPMEPMESSGYTGSDAGEDTLLVGLPKGAVLAKLDENLSSVPYIKGVNNHMGSKFMENQELMDMVLEEIDSRGLFFIDSMTSSGSVGYKTALMMGMKTGKRDVFLDDSSKDAAYVKSQIEKLVGIAEKNGYAVGICHPYPGTVEVLTEMIPQIDSRVDIVPVSSILTGGGEVSER